MQLLERVCGCHLRWAQAKESVLSGSTDHPDHLHDQEGLDGMPSVLVGVAGGYLELLDDGCCGLPRNLLDSSEGHDCWLLRMKVVRE